MALDEIRGARSDRNKLQGPAVDIIVGLNKDQTLFSVHESLVRKSSTFFEKALAGGWKEGIQHTIQLPNDDPEIFALYVHWLYYRTLPVYSGEPGPRGNTEYMELARAYTLGDKLLDPGFQNAVIYAFIEKSTSKAPDGSTWYPVGEVIQYIYANTMETAPIREMLVDMYIGHGNGNWLSRYWDPDNIPRAFLLELAKKLMERRGGLRDTLTASKYYIHQDI